MLFPGLPPQISEPPQKKRKESEGRKYVAIVSGLNISGKVHESFETHLLVEYLLGELTGSQVCKPLCHPAILSTYLQTTTYRVRNSPQPLLVSFLPATVFQIRHLSPIPTKTILRRIDLNRRNMVMTPQTTIPFLQLLSTVFSVLCSIRSLSTSCPEILIPQMSLYPNSRFTQPCFPNPRLTLGQHLTLSLTHTVVQLMA